MREALAEAGRDPASFRIAKRIIAVDDNAERARQHVAASLVRFYGAFGRRLEPAAVSVPRMLAWRACARWRRQAPN